MINSSAPARPVAGELTGLRFLLENPLDGPAAEHGLGLRGGRPAPGVGAFVAFLDQEPFLPVRRRSGPDQGVGALDLLAEHEDLHVALLDRLGELHRLAAPGLRDVLEDASIPDDHRPGAVLALRDHALPLEVLERMVLGSHREPLVAGIEGGPLRDRPGGEHAVDLEPQVVVLRGGGVLLDREARMAALRLALPLLLRAARLSGLREIALALVLGQLSFSRRHQTATSSSPMESASAPRSPSRSEIASGSEQSPKASSPPSEMIETRRAWRSEGSAKELNCSTAWPRISARCLGPGTFEIERANSRGPEVILVTPRYSGRNRPRAWKKA